MCPNGLDIEFVANFTSFLKKQAKKGEKFITIAGGGNTARKYINAATKLGVKSKTEKDWIGIQATRINAFFLRSVFSKSAHPKVLKDRRIKSFGKHSIIVGCGFQPGWSTDYDAVEVAKDFKIKRVVLLGKPSYVYDKNPDENKDAKPIEKLSWKEYLKMFPLKWEPGMHLPIDPMASKLAKKEKIEVIVANGADFDNFVNIIEGKEYKGTLVY